MILSSTFGLLLIVQFTNGCFGPIQLPIIPAPAPPTAAPAPPTAAPAPTTAAPAPTTAAPAPTTAAPAPVTTAPPSSCQCGQTNRISKIVGGVETEQNEYPWQVGLLSSRFSSTPFCGGTLISNTEVLTAAHCTEGGGANYVLLGEHDLTANDGQSVVQVCGVKDHPDYNSATTNYDFSILTLCNPVTYSTSVRPACLPSSASTNYDNVEAVVSGWGTTSSGGSQPDVLMEATVNTMSNAECRGSTTAYRPSQITDQMICAAFAGRDSCQGDSGGPLVTADSNGFYTLIGVVSWGYGCAQSNAPGVYGRVTSVLPWINDNTSGNTCTRSSSFSDTQQTGSTFTADNQKIASNANEQNVRRSAVRNPTDNSKRMGSARMIQNPISE